MNVEYELVVEAGVVVAASDCNCAQYEPSHLVQEVQVSTPLEWNQN